MITFFILFIVIQSRITDSFTNLEVHNPNDIQPEDVQSKGNFTNTVINKMFHALSCNFIYCGTSKRNESESVQIPENNTQPVNNSGVWENDDLTKSVATNEHNGYNEEDASHRSNNNRTAIGQRILLIIMCSIVLIIIGVICIVGIHRSTNEKLSQTRRNRPRPSRWLNVLPSDHENAYNSVPANVADDCPSCGGVQLNHPEESPHALCDSPPPSYDECVTTTNYSKFTVKRRDGL